MTRDNDTLNEPPVRSPQQWHCDSAASAVSTLGGDLQQGLSAADAAHRLEQYGPNLLQQGRKRSPLGILIDQFTDFMILVLIAAAVLSGVVGEMADTLAIIAIQLNFYPKIYRFNQILWTQPMRQRFQNLFS